MSTRSKSLIAAAFLISLPALASAQQCPSYESPGASLSYSSQDVWVPQSQTVIAGGDIDLAQCGALEAVGHVVENPDFTLQYDDEGLGRALEFRVTADCDAVLLVNSATGSWAFNDDDESSDPRIRFEGAPGGRYDIWVGTYDPATCEATLTIESF
jgi:hypothetical protein